MIKNIDSTNSRPLIAFLIVIILCVFALGATKIFQTPDEDSLNVKRYESHQVFSVAEWKIVLKSFYFINNQRTNKPKMFRFRFGLLGVLHPA
jgi:hypothetical protein